MANYFPALIYMQDMVSPKIAHLAALERTLMEMRREHLFRNFLQTFLGCAAGERHRRQSLRVSCPFPLLAVQCSFADRLDECHWFNWRNGLEERDW